MPRFSFEDLFLTKFLKTGFFPLVATDLCQFNKHEQVTQFGTYFFDSLYAAITIDTPLAATGSNGPSSSLYSTSVVHMVSFQLALQPLRGVIDVEEIELPLPVNTSIIISEETCVMYRLRIYYVTFLCSSQNVGRHKRRHRCGSSGHPFMKNQLPSIYTYLPIFTS